MSTDSDERPSTLWRPLLIGAIAIPPGVFFGAYGYLITQGIQWGQTSLQLGSVFTLFIVTGFSFVLGWVRRAWRLTRAELLIVYVMVSLSVCMSGVSMVPFLVNSMVAGRYFASPENKWEELFEHVPWWFGPTDAKIVTDYYEGRGTLYSYETLQHWAVPLSYWCVMLLLFVFGSLCIANLVGKQWVERERLTFPLVQLPVEITAQTGAHSIWRNKLMWVGFATAGLLESINYINYFFPGIPTVWLKARRLDSYFPTNPWRGMRPFSIAFYPFMIGIGFLLTLEASLSCWFFYLLGKAQNVICIATGLRGAGSSGIARLPMLYEQGCGAVLALMIAALWIAARPIKARITGADASPDTAGFLSPRFSAIGLAVTLLVLTWMGSMAGFPAYIGLPFFALYFVFVLGIGRIVAETGAGWTMVQAGRPRELVTATFGTSYFSPRALATLAYFSWFDDDYRDAPMPHLLAAMKMRSAVGIRGQHLLAGVGVSTIVGLLSSLWTHLHIYYTFGAATAKVRGWYTNVGRRPFNRLSSWVNSPLPRDWAGLGGSLFGAIVAVLLALARQRIPAWPFHPVGYAIAMTPSMNYLWMPFLVAWVLKLLVLRYAGIQFYRRIVPLFLGAIFGDFIIPSLWGLYGTLAGRRTYFFFPH